VPTSARARVILATSAALRMAYSSSGCIQIGTVLSYAKTGCSAIVACASSPISALPSRTCRPAERAVHCRQPRATGAYGVERACRKMPPPCGSYSRPIYAVRGSAKLRPSSLLSAPGGPPNLYDRSPPTSYVNTESLTLGVCADMSPHRPSELRVANGDIAPGLLTAPPHSQWPSGSGALSLQSSSGDSTHSTRPSSMTPSSSFDVVHGAITQASHCGVKITRKSVPPTLHLPSDLDGAPNAPCFPPPNPLVRRIRPVTE
jgi:hypothetical protein